jgi:hypothetical protein
VVHIKAIEKEDLITWVGAGVDVGAHLDQRTRLESEIRVPLSSECGTHKTVKAGLWRRL